MEETVRPPSHHFAWFCHSCQIQGGMTAFVDYCPNSDCQHLRCDHCIVEYLHLVESWKGRIQDKEKKEKKWAPQKRFEIGNSDPERQRQEEVQCVPSSPIQDLRDFNCRSPDLKPGMHGVEPATVVPPIISRRNRKTNSDSKPETASSPASLPPLSPDSASSTTTPNYFCETPSNVGSPYATTSTYSCITELDDEAESARLRWEYSMQVMECSLLSALRSHLPVAALLLPRIRAFMRKLAGAAACNVNSPLPCYDGGSSMEYRPNSNSNTTSSTPSSKFSGKISERTKRARGSDDEEQNHPDRPKKQKSRLDDLPVSEGSIPRYACPFHKRDPAKYHRDNNLRYGPCMGPGWPELRHLKYISKAKGHLKAAHRPAQCDRCFQIFKDIHQLTVHRQATCDEGLPNHKEGIDDSQWARIDVLIKTKRGLSPDERGQHHIDKWNTMWKILFGDLPLPPHPWHNELQVESSTFSSDTDSLMVAWDRDVEAAIQRNELPRNDQIQQQYRLVTRAFLEASLRVPDLRTASEGRAEDSGLSRDEPNVSSGNDVDPNSHSQNLDGVEALDHFANGFYQQLSVSNSTAESIRDPRVIDRNEDTFEGMQNLTVRQPTSQQMAALTYGNDRLSHREDFDTSQMLRSETYDTFSLPLFGDQAFDLGFTSGLASTNEPSSTDFSDHTLGNLDETAYQLSVNEAREDETLEAVLQIQIDIPFRPGENPAKHTRKAGVQPMDERGNLYQ